MMMIFFSTALFSFLFAAAVLRCVFILIVAHHSVKAVRIRALTTTNALAL
jgi:hypothetical protein